MEGIRYVYVIRFVIFESEEEYKNKLEIVKIVMSNGLIVLYFEIKFLCSFKFTKQQIFFLLIKNKHSNILQITYRYAFCV